MPASITIELTDEQLDALDAMNTVMFDDQGRPKYESTEAMCSGLFAERVLKQAFDIFPSADVSLAKSAMEAAVKRYEEVCQKASIASIARSPRKK